MHGNAKQIFLKIKIDLMKLWNGYFKIINLLISYEKALQLDP